MNLKPVMIAGLTIALVGGVVLMSETNVDEKLMIALGVKTGALHDASLLIEDSATSISGKIYVGHGHGRDLEITGNFVSVVDARGRSLPVVVPMYFTESDYDAISGKSVTLPITKGKTGRTAVLEVKEGVRLTDEKSESAVLGKAPIDPVPVYTPNIRTAVIGFTFQNTSGVYPAYFDPASPTGPKQAFFTDPNSTKAYYTEVSGGNANLIGSLDPSGDVFGPYTVAANQSCWPQYDAGPLARQAAAADGFVGTNYDVIIMIFPVNTSNPSCPAGFANLPLHEAYSGGWDMNVAHEVGHVIGRAHANAYKCTNASGSKVTYGNDCSNYEYGDPFDVMGHNGLHHFNPVGKIFQGFLGASGVQTVTTSGTYTLDQTNKVIAIPRDYYTYYVLDYRPPNGMFDQWNPSDPAANGVTMRIYEGDMQHVSVLPFDKAAKKFSSTLQNYGAMDYRSHLLDTTPGSVAAGDDFIDAPILVGQTYDEADRGISITTNYVSLANKTAEVSIDITCQQFPVTLTAASITPNLIGALLKNNDSLGCASSRTVNLSTGSLPLGWSFSAPYETPWSPVVVPNTVTLNSQESILVYFDLTPTGAVPYVGLQDISITATEIATGSNSILKYKYEFLPAGCEPSVYSVSLTPHAPITGWTGQAISAVAGFGAISDPDCTTPVSFTNYTYTVDTAHPKGYVEKGPEMFAYPTLSQSSPITIHLPGPHPTTGSKQLFLNFTCPTHFTKFNTKQPYLDYGCVKYSPVSVTLVPPPSKDIEAQD